MPLSWNEIRNRAHEFSKRWEGESSERAEAQRGIEAESMGSDSIDPESQSLHYIPAISELICIFKASCKIYRVSLTPDAAGGSTAAVASTLDAAGVSMLVASGGVCCGPDGLAGAACFFTMPELFKVL
jgi:hypothetical protein